MGEGDDHVMDTAAKQGVWDHDEIEKIAGLLEHRGWLRRGNTFQKPNAPAHYTISEAVESAMKSGIGRRM